MSRTRLPKKVKIGYSVFKIKHCRKGVDIGEVRKKGKAADFGECDFASQTIRVFGKQGPDEFCNTILHEILHGINDIHKIKFKSSKQEEAYVTSYADTILTLFKDNPRLLTWIQRQLKKQKLSN
jgi:hypothetical protein